MNSNLKKLSIGKERQSGLTPHLFCKLSHVNICEFFLKLIDRYFSKDNSLKKIFSRNTLKISYSCTINIFKIIYNHNKNLRDKSVIDNQRTNKLLFNGRDKEDCPMGGMCNSKKEVDQAR